MQNFGSKMAGRQLGVLLMDMFISVIAWYGAYMVRFNFSIPYVFFEAMLMSIPLVVIVPPIVSYNVGIQESLWRFIGIIDLRKLLGSITIATALIFLLLFLMQRGSYIPRSVVLLYPLLFITLSCGLRLAYRSAKDSSFFVLKTEGREPVFVLGAGVAGEKLIRQLRDSSKWYVAGLLDDDVKKWGGLIHGAKVLGSLDKIAKFAEKMAVSQAILAMPSVNHEIRRKVVSRCKQAGIVVLTVPAIDDLVLGNVSVSEVRELELDDLLGRNPVNLDVENLRDYVRDNAILVTGAGGSIGSELCRQLARFSPKLIVFWELSEYALYKIETEFKDRFPHIKVECIIGDVKSNDRVSEVLRVYRPQIIFHAAAYKHVPLMEIGNAFEAAHNNVYGTLVLAREAKRQGVKDFVLISTDKAVNPTNVMGATKRLSEMVCEELKASGNSLKTRFVITRFGNVIGSTGSVIPRFQSQIRSGGPVTVTHPNIKRYFMSISEAAQLVLQALIMSDKGAIFVLNMGRPVLIAEIAKEMIKLSGKKQDEIGIVYTGLRKGEKMTEELLAKGESLFDTSHPKLQIAKPRPVTSGLIAEIEAWFDSNTTAGEQKTKNQLLKWVPEYRSHA